MKLNRGCCLSLILVLSACSHEAAGVRISNDAPAPAKPSFTPQAKVEPVFYNGKTYQVSFAPQAAGSYSLSIAGMSASQIKDANALTTSTLHHFACKDSQKAVLSGAATFDGGNWISTGRCV